MTNCVFLSLSPLCAYIFHSPSIVLTHFISALRILHRAFLRHSALLLSWLLIEERGVIAGIVSNRAAVDIKEERDLQEILEGSQRAEEVGLDGDREGGRSEQCVWVGGEPERGGGDRKKRETLSAKPSLMVT